ncbi:MAG: HD domain-containing protein [Chthonomonas sp.]|nr:HD domain-containing protein [Chthonomonas sp.]
MSEYRDPKYLNDEDQPTDRVRCPIHGFIRYSTNERKIIDTEYFQRLRFIRQLGLTEYAYPGANHTRFEHSLGVMEMASAMFDSLAAKKGETMEAELSGLSWFAKNPLAKARQIVRLAALLHDTGHAPFSHAAEGAFHKEGHEALSIKIIREKELLGKVIDNTWGEGTANHVGLILDKDETLKDELGILAPQLKFLQEIISGEIDADRTDYLRRDAYHCGVEYGRFDHKRLIECLTLRPIPGVLEIAVTRDGIHTVEALILARFQMNAQVYFHRIRRIYDHFLIEYHKALYQDEELRDQDVLKLNDMRMLNQLILDSSSGEAGGRFDLARRIIGRNHPRLIYETGDDADSRTARLKGDLANEIKKKYTDVYVHYDDMGPKPVTIHKIYVSGSEEGGVELMVIGRNNAERLVGDESKILSRIPKSFRCCRIFADIKDAEHRKELEDFINQRSTT